MHREKAVDDDQRFAQVSSRLFLFNIDRRIGPCAGRGARERASASDAPFAAAAAAAAAGPRAAGARLATTAATRKPPAPPLAHAHGVVDLLGNGAMPDGEWPNFLVLFREHQQV